MDTVTLDIALHIAKSIELYTGPMTNDNLMAYIERETKASKYTIARVIEFLQKVTPKVPVSSTPASAPPPAPIIDSEPLNLMDEFEFNYKVAKNILTSNLIDTRAIDPEETRKSLKTIAMFMEQALKLQERLHNVQQMQRFQEAVLDTLANIDPIHRDSVITALLESEL